MTDAPDLLPLNGNDDATAPGQPAARRWLLGISLTVGLNLAITVAAFAGLSVQYHNLSLEQDKLDLEQNKAITEQVTSASELLSSDDFNAQAAGFRTLERVARISPPTGIVSSISRRLTSPTPGPQPRRSRAPPPSAGCMWRTWARRPRWT
ncbi:hypothetical protein ACFQ0O_11485 [Saccharopolyspora spinosporotrichia]